MRLLPYLLSCLSAFGCVTDDQAGCATDVPCVVDDDCAMLPGTRCNTAIETPHCVQLYCLPLGAECALNSLCDSQACGGEVCRECPNDGSFCCESACADSLHHMRLPDATDKERLIQDCSAVCEVLRAECDESSFAMYRSGALQAVTSNATCAAPFQIEIHSTCGDTERNVRADICGAR